jgi:hypothetical protein
LVFIHQGAAVLLRNAKVRITRVGHRQIIHKGARRRVETFKSFDQRSHNGIGGSFAGATG